MVYFFFFQSQRTLKDVFNAFTTIFDHNRDLVTSSLKYVQVSLRLHVTVKVRSKEYCALRNRNLYFVYCVNKE